MFNKVVLVGNLTRNIELRYSSSGGTAVGVSGIAVNRRYTVNNEKKEETCFVDLTFFGRTAEIANQYLSKGSKVLIEGRLKQDSWVDANGQNRSKHLIVVESMEMLGSNSNSYSSDYDDGRDTNRSYSNEPRRSSYDDNRQNSYVEKSRKVENEPKSQSKFDEDMDDEIPF